MERRRYIFRSVWRVVFAEVMFSLEGVVEERSFANRLREDSSIGWKSMRAISEP